MNRRTLTQTALFALSYFALMAVGVSVGRFVDHTPYKFLASAMTAVFGGIAYFYFVPRIRTFGAITIVGTLMGSFFLLTGHMAWASLPGFLFGFLADLIARQGAYKNTTLNVTSFLAFAYTVTGPILMMWLMRSAYIASLVARGKTSDYINSVMVPATTSNITSFLLSVLLGGAIGAGIGLAVNKYLPSRDK